MWWRKALAWHLCGVRGLLAVVYSCFPSWGLSGHVGTQAGRLPSHVSGSFIFFSRKRLFNTYLHQILCNRQKQRLQIEILLF